ncbi:hypothetical protein ACFV8Z_04760 [Streptomyces sp. NPDC059837]|uniref:hypothetical protein n=1 Tax=Streptomyces sp. NPDC059837 TaxID=3346968 RepID=UPI00364F4C1F
MIAWLPGMSAATPAPIRAEVSAVEYYRPDDRFAPDTNAARIALAQDHAAERLPADVAEQLRFPGHDRRASRLPRRGTAGSGVWVRNALCSARTVSARTA